MRRLPKTVRYQLARRELVDLNRRVRGLAREDRDVELQKFEREHGGLITIGVGLFGIPKVEFDRKWLKYLRREGIIDVGVLQQKFIEYVRRHYTRSKNETKQTRVD